MANPNIDQGTLNRVRGSCVCPDFPELNVMASNLGEAGISINFEGDSTTMINTMVGRVTSLEPFVPASVTLNLLKTQNLANVYQKRMKKNSRIGDFVVYPDSSALDSVTLVNCAISKIDTITINGKDAGFVVTVAGTFQVNDDLFTLV